ncbi:hypothetical protein [Streptomyces sp. NBC_00503]|uniref:hypothetical protein n=1 Tax=Streptomyces sp. NBC_00503 TaxID=2903659 RepID=UPI002E820C70|nr:hypothetical protein [Streptomyces sp. NBC_00503]WUD80779.1 hypothetical protein OG490_09585 [Streptomyces sp. NBC_00503]
MAGSGVLAKVAGAVGGKTVAMVAAGAVVVAGAAGAGVWWTSHGPDPVVVVQRSTSVSVPAGGEQLTVAGCLAHETALGGGYAIAGSGFATNSHFIGGAWLASAFNPGDAPSTLTSYALCVNAKPEMQGNLDFQWPAYAFLDKSNKLAGPGGIHDATTEGPFAGTPTTTLATPHCADGFTMVGAEFKADRVRPARPVAPVPLDRLTPQAAIPGPAGAGTSTAAGASDFVARLNPGTELSSRSFPLKDSTDVLRMTLLLAPQPPQANFAVGVRPVCVKLKSVSVVTSQVAVAAGGSAQATVGCPKNRLLLGGGFNFLAANEVGALEAPQRYFGDGWLFAGTDGPAVAGTPSGSRVKEWHVTGVNQQKGGGLYHDSAWIEHSDAETSTGNVYLDAQAHGGDDQQLRPSPVPDAQPMIASAVCATVDAKATSPSKGPSPTSVGRPELPSVPGAVDPSVAASASVSPSVSPSASPSVSPSVSPSQSPGRSAPPSSGTPNSPGASPGRPTNGGNPQPSTSAPQQPQPPAVAIAQPAGGGKLRRGCEEHFAGSARTRPGDRAITDPQYTAWQLKGPNGPVAVGAGPSGSFLVPLLPDGTYPLVFTATDPGSGLTASAQVSVQIVGCIR